jgi:hypothetical protein
MGSLPLFSSPSYSVRPHGLAATHKDKVNAADLPAFLKS